MKLPIIVLWKHGLEIYDSVDVAALDVECLSMPEEEFEGYDAEGHRLRIYFDGDRVNIALRENEPPRPFELRALLIEKLRNRHVPAHDSMTVEELIVELRDYRRPPETRWTRFQAKARDRSACCLFAFGIVLTMMVLTIVVIFVLQRIALK